MYHRNFEREVLFLLQQIINKENLIMSTLQDLNTAITAESAEEQVLIDALNAAKANGDQAAIDAAVAAIEANTANMQSAVAPAPAPVPAPVVTPAP